MPMTKLGEDISWKEFFIRWKNGIEGLTPAQKLNAQLAGTRISLIGILLGLFVSLYGFKNLWWVSIILIGALINTYIQYVSLKQQKQVFIKIEEQMKGGTN